MLNHTFGLAVVLATLGLIAWGCNGDGDGDGDTDTDSNAELECPSTESWPDAYTVETDTTVSAGCYLVEETIWITNSATLTLSPGVILKFENEAGIEVESTGSLNATGTTEAPILLTGTARVRGHWAGVYFENTDSPNNRLEHVTVEYAGSFEMLDDGAAPLRAGVFLDSSGYDVALVMTASTIRQCAGFGLYLDHTATLSDLGGNTITQNAGGAVYAYATAVHNLTSNTDFSGNDNDRVYVNGDYGFGDQDQTWQSLGLDFQMHGDLLIYNHLTIEAPANLFFKENAGIQILDAMAGITAIGTLADPIVFSGLSQSAGYWDGLYFSNTEDLSPMSPRTKMDYVTVEYGGAYEFNDGQANPVRGNLMLDSSGYGVAIEISNSTLRNSSGYGMWQACESTVTGSGNTYSGNAWSDVGLETNC